MFSRKVLMCSPDHFEVTYKINPWMDPNSPDKAVDPNEARIQWTQLHHTIIRLGGYVEYVPPKAGQPDMVFTANAGLFHKGKVLLSQFRHDERRGEIEPFAAAFERLGYEVGTTGKDFEGAGDAFVMHDTLFLGHGFRTDRRVVTDILDFFGLSKVVLLELINPHFYHLDTCFCPITDFEAIYYPRAFAPRTVKAIESLTTLPGSPYRFHVVSDEDAERFACNAVVIHADKGSVVLPSGCNATAGLIKDRCKSISSVYMVPMTQFLKSGGACKCLTLQLSEHK